MYIYIYINNIIYIVREIKLTIIMINLYLYFLYNKYVSYKPYLIPVKVIEITIFQL